MGNGSSNDAGRAIWQKVLEQLASRVSEMELEIFLKPAVLVFANGAWLLHAADGSAEAYLKMVLFDKIVCALHEVGVSGGLQVASGRWSVVGEKHSPASKPTNQPNSEANRPLTTDHLWSSVQAELQLALPGRAWSTWLKDASLVEGEKGQYLIEVRNEQAQDWVQNRFAQLIVSIMAGLLGERDFSVSVKSRK